MGQYTVRAGDNWSTIAERAYGNQRYAVFLMATNGQSSYVMHEGDVIDIPDSPPPQDYNISPDLWGNITNAGTDLQALSRFTNDDIMSGKYMDSLQPSGESQLDELQPPDMSLGGMPQQGMNKKGTESSSWLIPQTNLQGEEEMLRVYQGEQESAQGGQETFYSLTNPSQPAVPLPFMAKDTNVSKEAEYGEGLGGKINEWIAKIFDPSKYTDEESARQITAQTQSEIEWYKQQDIEDKGIWNLLGLHELFPTGKELLEFKPLSWLSDTWGGALDSVFGKGTYETLKYVAPEYFVEASSDLSIGDYALAAGAWGGSIFDNPIQNIPFKIAKTSRQAIGQAFMMLFEGFRLSGIVPVRKAVATLMGVYDLHILRAQYGAENFFDSPDVDVTGMWMDDMKDRLRASSIAWESMYETGLKSMVAIGVEQFNEIFPDNTFIDRAAFSNFSVDMWNEARTMMQNGLSLAEVETQIKKRYKAEALLGFMTDLVLDFSNLIPFNFLGEKKFLTNSSFLYKPVGKFLKAVVGGQNDVEKMVELAKSGADMSDEFARLTKAVLDTTRQGIDDIWKRMGEHKFFGLTQMGKRFIMGRNVAMFEKVILDKFAKNPDELAEVIKAMVESIPRNWDNADDIAKAIKANQVLASKMGATFLSRAGCDFRFVLASLSGNDIEKFGEEFMRNRKSILTMTDWIASKYQKVLDHIFPSFGDMRKAWKAGETATETQKMWAKMYEQIPSSMKPVLNVVDRLDRPYSAWNRFFSTLYMGMSPGYAFRNLFQNSLHVFLDQGADAGIESFFASVAAVFGRRSYLYELEKLAQAEGQRLFREVDDVAKRIKLLENVVSPVAKQGIGFHGAEVASHKWWDFRDLSTRFESIASTIIYRETLKRELRTAAMYGFDPAQDLIRNGLSADQANLIKRLFIDNYGDADATMRIFRELAGKGVIPKWRVHVPRALEDRLREIGLYDNFVEGLRKIEPTDEAIDAYVAKVKEACSGKVINPVDRMVGDLSPEDQTILADLIYKTDPTPEQEELAVAMLSRQSKLMSEIKQMASDDVTQLSKLMSAGATPDQAHKLTADALRSLYGEPTTLGKGFKFDAAQYAENADIWRRTYDSVYAKARDIHGIDEEVLRKVFRGEDLTGLEGRAKELYNAIRSYNYKAPFSNEIVSFREYLIKHADDDSRFQKKVADFFRENMRKNWFDYRHKNIAYIGDAVMAQAKRALSMKVIDKKAYEALIQKYRLGLFLNDSIPSMHSAISGVELYSLDALKRSAMIQAVAERFGLKNFIGDYKTGNMRVYDNILDDLNSALATDKMLPDLYTPSRQEIIDALASRAAKEGKVVTTEMIDEVSTHFQALEEETQFAARVAEKEEAEQAVEQAAKIANETPAEKELRLRAEKAETELNKWIEEYHKLATDTLTEKSVTFSPESRKLIQSAKRVVVIDATSLGTYNARYGEEALAGGDQFLRRLSMTIDETLTKHPELSGKISIVTRGGSLTSASGGDNFVIAFSDDVGSRKVKSLMEEMQKNFQSKWIKATHTKRKVSEYVTGHSFWWGQGKNFDDAVKEFGAMKRAFPVRKGTFAKTVRHQLTEPEGFTEVFTEADKVRLGAAQEAFKRGASKAKGVTQIDKPAILRTLGGSSGMVITGTDGKRYNVLLTDVFNGKITVQDVTLPGKQGVIDEFPYEYISEIKDAYGKTVYPLGSKAKGVTQAPLAAESRVAAESMDVYTPITLRKNPSLSAIKEKVGGKENFAEMRTELSEEIRRVVQRAPEEKVNQLINEAEDIRFNMETEGEKPPSADEVRAAFDKNPLEHYGVDNDFYRFASDFMEKWNIDPQDMADLISKDNPKLAKIFVEDTNFDMADSFREVAEKATTAEAKLLGEGVTAPPKFTEIDKALAEGGLETNKVVTLVDGKSYLISGDFQNGQPRKIFNVKTGHPTADRVYKSGIVKVQSTAGETLFDAAAMEEKRVAEFVDEYKGIKIYNERMKYTPHSRTSPKVFVPNTEIERQKMIALLDYLPAVYRYNIVVEGGEILRGVEVASLRKSLLRGVGEEGKFANFMGEDIKELGFSWRKIISIEPSEGIFRYGRNIYKTDPDLVKAFQEVGISKLESAGIGYQRGVVGNIKAAQLGIDDDIFAYFQTEFLKTRDARGLTPEAVSKWASSVGLDKNLYMNKNEIIKRMVSEGLLERNVEKLPMYKYYKDSRKWAYVFDDVGHVDFYNVETLVPAGKFRDAIFADPRAEQVRLLSTIGDSIRGTTSRKATGHLSFFVEEGNETIEHVVYKKDVINIEHWNRPDTGELMVQDIENKFFNIMDTQEIKTKTKTVWTREMAEKAEEDLIAEQAQRLMKETEIIEGSLEGATTEEKIANELIPDPHSRTAHRKVVAKKLFNELDNWAAGLKSGGIRDSVMVSLDPQVEKALGSWYDNVRARNLEIQARAHSVATANRDFALHAYGDKMNMDLVVNKVMPYSYWYMREYPRMITRLVNDPRIVNNYMKYRRFLETIHAGLPDWWKYQLSTNDLPGAELTNPLFLNLEATLNPMYGLSGVDFNDPRKRVDWLSTAVDNVGKFGPSLFTPLNWLVAAHLYAKGEKEAGARWMGRLIPQTALLKGLAWKLGIKLPEPFKYNEIDPFVLAFSGGMDAYERGRVGRVLGELVDMGQRTPQEAQQAAYLQSGEVWDEAVALSQDERFMGQLTSFLFGVGFKARTQTDLEIDRFYNDYYLLMDSRPNLSPEEFKNALTSMHANYPFMDTVLISRKESDDRDTAYAYSVLSRIAPGQRTELLKLVGIDYETYQKFYDNKGTFTGFTEKQKNSFRDGIFELGAILEIPDEATSYEWNDAITRYNVMRKAVEAQFGSDIYNLINRYYLAESKEEFSIKYPIVIEALEAQNQFIMGDQLLYRYYGGLDILEGYYRGQIDKILSTRYPNIEQLFDDYNACKLADATTGGKTASAYWRAHPELAKYLDDNNSLWDEARKHIIDFAGKLPDAKQTRTLEDLRNLSGSQEKVVGALQEQGLTWKQWSSILSEPLQELLMEYFESGGSIPDAVLSALTSLNYDNNLGYKSPEDMVTDIGIAYNRR